MVETHLHLFSNLNEELIKRNVHKKTKDTLALSKWQQGSGTPVRARKRIHSGYTDFTLNRRMKRRVWEVNILPGRGRRRDNLDVTI